MIKLAGRKDRYKKGQTDKMQDTKIKRSYEDNTDLHYSTTPTCVSNEFVVRQSLKQFRMFCQTVVLPLPLLLTYLCYWSQPCKPFFCKLPLINIYRYHHLEIKIQYFKTFPVVKWDLSQNFWFCSTSYFNEQLGWSLTVAYCTTKGSIDLPKYTKSFSLSRTALI